MNVREASTVLATWAVVIGTLAGGYAALNTYQQEAAKTLDDRQKQTFALVLHFISSDFLAIRDKMIKVVRTAERCGDIAGPLGEMSESERFAFFEFFDIVDTCTATRTCDDAFVERVFVPYANGHWPVLKGYVEDVRRGEEPHKLKTPFAAGLEHLAHAALPLPNCPSR